jgi:hypothetical protein
MSLGIQAKEKVGTVRTTEKCHIRIQKAFYLGSVTRRRREIRLKSVQLHLIYMNLIRKKVVGSIRP